MSKRVGFIILALLFAVAALAVAGGTKESAKPSANAAQQLGSNIQWNKPESWPKRLLANDYILPTGWKTALAGVKEITFYNSGGLKYDPATVTNMLTFQKLTGIKVNAVPVSADLAEAKSLATLAAHDKSVDAVLVNDPAYNLSALAATGLVTPVDIMYPSEVTDLYNPDLKSDYTWDGHWYALQVAYIGHIDFYRPSWLKAAGVNVPTTYTELPAAIAKVNAWAKQNHGTGNFGAVFTGSTQDALNWYRTLMYSQGQKLYVNGKYEFDSVASQNAFRMMVELVRNNEVPKDVLNYSWGDVGQFFGEGKAGFMFGMQPSYLTTYESGDFPAVASDVAPLAPPKWSQSSPDSYADRGVVGVNSMLINAAISNEQKEAVMLFADYVRSLQGQRNEVIVEGNESPLKYLWQTIDQQVKNIDWTIPDQVGKMYQITLPHRTTVPAAKARAAMALHTVFEVYPPGFTQISQTFVQQFSKAALGNTSVADAIKAIQDFANQLTSS